MNDPRLFPGAASMLGRLLPEETGYERSGFGASMAAGFAAEAANDLADRNRLLRDAYQPLVEELNRQPGVRLGNPYDMGGDAQVDPAAQERVLGEVWRELEKRRAQMPGVPRSREDLEGSVLDSMRASQRLAEDLEGRAGVAGTIGSFVGRAGGAMADPTNQLSMLLGAPAGSGAARIIVTEALLGAASNVATRPQRGALAETLGVEMPPIGEEALLGAAFGAAGGGAVAGGQALARLSGRQIGRLFDRQVAQPTPEQRAAREALERAEDIADSSPLIDTPRGRAEHVERLSAAIDALDRGTAAAVPDRPLNPAIAPDSLDGVVHRFRPDELQVDAETFQFKAGGDAEGVSDRLAGIDAWDQAKAGQVLVWERADGSRFIADGHQRLGLARRQAEPPPLYGLLFREADGWDAETLRVVAAMKNIAEGTGTALDAAKVLRVAPERMAELPPRSELVRQAQGLVKLSDPAFGMVVNELVPARYAALVGELVPAEAQPSVLGLLARAEPANATQAEAMVRQALMAGVTREKQVGLFGEEEVVASLYAERARVLDRSLKDLRKDRAVFATLAGESGRIEGEGNVLATDANAVRKAADDRALALLQRLAHSVGPVSDALNAAAREYRDTGELGRAAARVAEAVRRAAADGDVARLQAGRGERALGLADEDAAAVADQGAADEVARFDEPGGKGQAGKGQVEQIRDLLEELFPEASAARATEPGAEGLPQHVLPGTERSAHQAMAARDSEGGARPRVPQQVMDGGLFGRAEPGQPSLLDAGLDTIPVGEVVDEDGTLRAVTMTREELQASIDADSEFAAALETICRVAP
ncbi:MAG TPA: hypothetical protein PKA13_21515 [Geminicoccaceae bacterium]|nr:hypothetical protein [Geminicoccus sp.]HMU52373.1 hypothetical protein [Geminicoccaceae bacterium]